MSIEPELTVALLDSMFDVSVRIDGLDTMSNFQVFVRFDPGVVEFVEAFEGSLYVYTGTWDNTWFFFEEESLGTWEIFDVIFPTMSYIRPPGELTQIRFRAAGLGYTPIEIVGASVKDIHRNPVLPLEIEQGSAYVGDPTGVGSEGSRRAGWSMGRPFPNPTVAGTSLMLAAPAIAGETPARLAVFDFAGRLVRSIDVPSVRGTSEIAWDGRDREGREVAPGVYFVRLEAGARDASRKVVVVR
ncbi:MAG: FlgD immunoglobulin-like domain containing protein [Candidatus Eisenbacteria bacterium]